MSHAFRLFLLFALSGFAGIIYESIWSHYLKLFLGHAAYAQTIVLVVFMGGLAFGSWLGARVEKNSRDPLRIYIAVEIGIGILGLLFHPVFIAVTQLVTSTVFPAVDQPLAVHVLKTGVAAGLLLPPSILLGMTFPLMTVGIIRRRLLAPGFAISNLYFVNSLGAAIGILVSGFILIGWLGLTGTVRFAGSMNIIIALLVYLTLRRVPLTRAGDDAGAVPLSATSSASSRLLLYAAALTGCASFIYEIAWIRMLNMVLGTSTHSFELMLSAFIVGLALGGRWIGRHLDSDRNWFAILGLIQLAMAVFACSTLAFYDFSFVLMSLIFHSVSSTPPGYGLYMVLSNGIAFMVMLPTTICAGMTLPIMTHCLLRSGYGNRGVGEIYAANTSGAIVGIIIAIHLLLPLLGLKAALLTGAGIDMLLGIHLLRRAGYGRDAVAATIGALAFALVVAAFVDLDPLKMSAGVFRHGTPALADDSVIEFRKDGKSASVSVFRINHSTRVIATNGKPDASMELNPELPPSSDESTQVLISALATMLKPEMREAAIIGIGSGMTTHVLLQNPGLERVDTIEIEAQMVAGAELFRPQVERTFSDPRSHIHIDDARTFFATRGTRYDAILSEPSNPWVSGVSGLFTAEFYQQVSNHLAPNGIFAQWLQLYEIDLDLVASVFKAFSSTFPQYRVFEMDDGNVLLVAQAGAEPLRTFAAEQVLSMGDMSSLLNRVDIRSAGDLQSRYLADAALLQPMFLQSPAPPNSDFRPFLDINAAYTRFLGANSSHFGEFARAAVPVREMLSARPPPAPGTTAHTNSVYSTLNALTTARTLHERIISGASDQLDAVEPALATAAALLGGGTGCHDQNERRVRLRAAIAVAAASLPLLAPGNAAALATALHEAGCLASAAHGDSWSALLESIAHRAPLQMRDAAATLLRRTEDALVAEHRLMLLQAQFLGNILLDSAASNLQIWDELNTEQRVQAEASITMRILHAHSVSAGNAVTP